MNWIQRRPTVYTSQSALLTILLLLAAGALTLRAATARLSVDVDKPGHAISPMLYGIFFEDINCSADGGLYAEMVRNRNFEDADTPEHWDVVSSGLGSAVVAVDSSKPVSKGNPRSLRVQVVLPGKGKAGVANNGFWGIPLRDGEVCDLSFMARGGEGFAGPLLISLQGRDGTVYGEEKISKLTSEWNTYRVKLTPRATDPRARLVISSEKAGVFWLDMVSLFPKKTWKDSGLRTDLAEMLMGLKPAFMRFPGGCWVEGETMGLAYRWKQTIGDLSERRTQYNIWRYYATHGIGYHEYLVLCENLGAEPLFVFNCGMSHKETVPMDKMDEYVQDALDAIEYANGPVTSTWGSVRAKNGHPAPFNMKYVEIGNENGGRAYNERYALFVDAIKAKYPDMRLIANEWRGLPTSRTIEIADEHYYNTPEFFIQNATRYDSYDRRGHKVYVGEYAVTRNGGEGNLRAAVGEAAFMTGMERNSDVVVMSSYAPLFANVNYKKWNPDLINFDSSRVYGLPGYYVQKMFSENLGDVVLPLTIDAAEVPISPRAGAIGVGTWLTQAEYKDIKVTRDGQVLFSADFADGMKGWKQRGGEWSVSDGILQQKSMAENVRAFAGDKNWTNYTYALKARKVAGNEGFLIPFLVQDENAKCWWNLGGWGNVRHGLEMDGMSVQEVPGRIETGRWYDIRIEIHGVNVKCYLDDKLVHDASFANTKPLYAVASKASGGSEVILKVVNVSVVDQPSEIKLNGVKTISRAAATVLASQFPSDENTLDQPVKVAPVASNLNAGGSTLSHTFPANSVTVLRLKVH